MKRILPYLLAAFFVVQLAVPGYLVFRHYHTLQTGESYKFAVTPRDPYDPFRGRYVALSAAVLPLYSSDGEYALLEKDGDGYAQITQWQENPPERGDYIKNPRLDRYYMNERLAPKAELLRPDPDSGQDTMYLLVKVRRGHFVIAGLYLNDVPVEELAAAAAAAR